MFKAIFKILVFSISISLLVTCGYEFPESPYPRIETLPVEDISESGVTFQAKITRLGDKPIIDHGFVWGFEKDLSINSEDKIQLGSDPSGSFEAAVKYGLYPDTTYYVKAFIATDAYFVYGKVVSFRSKGGAAPQIQSFAPETGTWGDTITINGAYFSTVNSNNVVKFGSFGAKVLSSTASTIRCIVPNDVPDTTVPIYITVTGKQSRSANDFTFISPAIQSFSPATGTFDDIVTIVGTDFSDIKSHNFVKFDEYNAEVTEASATQLKVKVPAAIRKKENTISVTVNLQSTTAADAFDILPPTITSLSSSGERIYSTIQISGNNFNPTVAGNKVLFGERTGLITTATKTMITVSVPAGIYPSRSFPVGVEVAEQTAFSTGQFTIQNAWIQKPTMQPVEPRESAVVFTINGKGYIGLGARAGHPYKTFWEYDPATNAWTSLPDFPGDIHVNPVFFAIGDFAYVGGGYDPYTIETLYDFWKLDPQNRTWTRVGDLPASIMVSPTVRPASSYATAEKGYVLLTADRYDEFEGDTNNFWEYDPTNDQWSGKANFVGQPFRTGGFSIGNKVFVHSWGVAVDYNFLDEYNTDTDTWTFKSEMYYFNLGGWNVSGFSINGKGYLSGTAVIHKYSPGSNSWEQLPEEGVSGFPFVINEKAYVWNGTTFWEFDPDFE